MRSNRSRGRSPSGHATIPFDLDRPVCTRCFSLISSQLASRGLGNFIIAVPPIYIPSWTSPIQNGTMWSQGWEIEIFYAEVIPVK